MPILRLPSAHFDSRVNILKFLNSKDKFDDTKVKGILNEAEGLLAKRLAEKTGQLGATYRLAQAATAILTKEYPNLVEKPKKQPKQPRAF